MEDRFDGTEKRPRRPSRSLLRRSRDRLFPGRSLQNGSRRSGRSRRLRANDARVPGILGADGQRSRQSPSPVRVSGARSRRSMVSLRRTVEGGVRRRRRPAGHSRGDARGGAGIRRSGRPGGTRRNGLIGRARPGSYGRLTVLLPGVRSPAASPDPVDARGVPPPGRVRPGVRTASDRE